uniref:hypothetical protein n=1 Tax=Pseudoruminococcus massiliensis TaxID=2086583 RepID=UPI003FED5C1B
YRPLFSFFLPLEFPPLSLLRNNQRCTKIFQALAAELNYSIFPKPVAHSYATDILRLVNSITFS